MNAAEGAGVPAGRDTAGNNGDPGVSLHGGGSWGTLFLGRGSGGDGSSLGGRARDVRRGLYPVTSKPVAHLAGLSFPGRRPGIQITAAWRPQAVGCSSPAPEHLRLPPQGAVTPSPDAHLRGTGQRAGVSETLVPPSPGLGPHTLSAGDPGLHSQAPLAPALKWPEPDQLAGAQESRGHLASGDTNPFPCFMLTRTQHVLPSLTSVV